MANIYKAINASGTGGGGGGTASTFAQIFNATTDWGAPSGGFYSITVAQATHGKGTDPIVQTYEDVAGTDELVDTEILMDSFGNVTIRVPDSVDTRFAGKVVIV